ncbi:MAG: hypothetical protein KAV87_43135, partial [Desulfobacteraceae bacterium]|nr:hypothetical protein [Desulfobacteraceae bacterium]
DRFKGRSQILGIMLQDCTVFLQQCQDKSIAGIFFLAGDDSRLGISFFGDFERHEKGDVVSKTTYKHML